jgi:hypothetical protein
MLNFPHSGWLKERGTVITTMLSLQSPVVNSTEFDAPKTDRLPRDDDATFSQKIFDIAVT